MKTLLLILLGLTITLQCNADFRQLASTEHSCWIGGSYKTDCDCPKNKCEPPKVIYKTKWRTKERIVEKITKEDAPKNNISLIGMRTYSDLEVVHTPGKVHSETTSHLGVGLMYQRRFSNWRASIGATTNSSIFLGFGRDF